MFEFMLEFIFELERPFIFMFADEFVDVDGAVVAIGAGVEAFALVT